MNDISTIEEDMEATTVYRTDQTDCFDSNGTRIPCKSTGQDGELRCGIPWPEPRFIFDEITVKDLLTGLMWSRSGALRNFPMTWDEAFGTIEHMNRLKLFGFEDWRLPEYRELFSLISHRNVNPALPDSNPFVDVFHGYYWTATPCSRLPLESWYVHLGGGRVFKGMKHGSYMLWPVRHFSNAIIDHNPLNPTRRAYENIMRNAMSANDSNKSETDLSTRRFERSVATIVDRATNLMWWRNACSGAAPVNWDEAFDAVLMMNRSAAGGFDDWRLPNIREIESLLDIRYHSPALPAGFHDIPIQSGCWTSTSSALDPRYAWVLYTQDGALGVGFKTKKDFHTLVVRSRGEAWDEDAKKQW